MKKVSLIFASFLALGMIAAAQTAQPDPTEPSLTFDEEKALMLDDLHIHDVQVEISKEYATKTAPLIADEDANKAAIEKEHPGYHLESIPGYGWKLIKGAPKPADKK